SSGMLPLLLVKERSHPDRARHGRETFSNPPAATRRPPLEKGVSLFHSFFFLRREAGERFHFGRLGRIFAPSLFQREQLCQQGIALCQVLFDFTIALSTVSSFRMQAVMATLGCLPAARSRSWTARISGLQRIALLVAL